MTITESELKKQIKEGRLQRVYFFYGEETYLSGHYAAQVAAKAVGGDEMAGLQSSEIRRPGLHDGRAGGCGRGPALDGGKQVRGGEGLRRRGGGAANQERLLRLVSDPPESCVLVFWQDAVEADVKKNAKWKAFAAAVEKKGACVEFRRKSTADIVKLLCGGAARRGCRLQPDNARLLVEQCGDELHLLLNELDKLCALAGEGEITREMIETAGTKNLEASVFDLSKAILQNHYARAYAILHRLLSQREEPVTILAVLSTAYADLYRAKVAAAAGKQADTLTADFQYRGKEFRLRNAARDASRLSIDVLRRSLDTLAQADLRLKSSRTDKRVVLEQTAARLIVLAKGG